MAKLKDGVTLSPQPKRTYKDLLFKAYFGKEEHKALTLQLYNALNGSSYTNVDDLEFYTLEDVLYLNYKNDVCFLVADTMNLYEQQSTTNPNMGYRMLLYFTRVVERYVTLTKQSQYSEYPMHLPFPIFAVFYNGRKEMEEAYKETKLSDLYEHEGKEVNAEIIVRWYNVKKNNNMELKESCPPLKQYSWTTETVQENLEKGMDLLEAIEATLDAMDESFILYDYIQAHRAEVIGMLDTEFSQKAYDQVVYDDGVRKGREEGIVEGREEGKKDSFRTLVERLMKKRGISKEEAIKEANDLLQMDQTL